MGAATGLSVRAAEVSVLLISPETMAHFGPKFKRDWRPAAPADSAGVSAAKDALQSR
jgi:hypothetical protein